MWSKKSNIIINNIKRTILMKKIMLNFMIDNYSRYDKLFRYCHMLIAALTPTIATINKLAATNEDQSNTVTLILSSLVAAMIKIKDYLKFDKIKETSKQQTIKYEQLYQRIEREMLKSTDRRQTEEDFIYWINREFNNIEISDPDISQSLKHKYIKFCKDNNIPFDNDINSLQILIHNTNISENKQNDILVENKTRIEQPVQENLNNADITVIEHGTNESVEYNNNSATNISNIDDDNVNNANADTNADTDTNANTDTNADTTKYISYLRPRTLSDENDKKEYKQKIQQLDIDRDLNWVLERLNTITDN